VRLDHLWLTDFRCYAELDLALTDGATVIRGANGQGKTSLLEAIGWAATGRSFRGVPDRALVRAGAASAIVRAESERAGNGVLVEAEIVAAGRTRVQVNRQSLPRRSELARTLRVTVFSPDDLDLVKGSPAGRRGYLDDLLVASAARYDAARSDFERVLRNRNALLRTGARDADARTTLDVFDDQLVAAAGELVRGRLRLADRLEPWLGTAYAQLAGNEAGSVTARYEAEWAHGPIDATGAGAVEDLLRAALACRRREEVDRRTTLVGPHRDEWKLALDDLDARTHASQGEQRTLALALRLAGHHVVGELIDEHPVLLLDDVFSELDGTRAAALVAHLPPGQTLVTTAGVLPPEIRAVRWLTVAHGRVEDAA
jgi:DNA replication and repair protein RecF